jgi:hypothetical protein
MQWNPKGFLFTVLFCLIVLSGMGCSHDIAGWKVVSTNHFRLYTDQPPNIYEPVLERMEDVYAGYLSSFFSHAIPIVEVFIFNTGEFQDLLGEVGGIFISNRKEPPLMVVPRAWDRKHLDRISANNLGQAFIAASGWRVPVWFRRGFANYCESMAIRENRVWFGSVVTNEANYASTNRLIPFIKLFSMTHNEFQGVEQARHEAAAWAMVHYLWHGENKTLRSRFETFITTLSTGPVTFNATLLAWQKVFPEIPVKELDDRVARHLHSVFVLPVATVSGFDLIRPEKQPVQVVSADMNYINTVRTKLRALRPKVNH